jgi:hypothetical protein
MRLAAKAYRQYPFYLRPFFWNQRRKYGQVLQALLWAQVTEGVHGRRGALWHD